MPTQIPRRRVVYIAGLSRGGSTILQKYLATHRSLVSVGESYFTLRALTGTLGEEVPVYPCTCGRTRNECELWGPLIEPLASATVEEGHALLLDRFDALHPHSILIDSSKEPPGLKRLYLEKARAGQIDLQVIFLVRDVRSWASAIRKYRRGRSSFVIEAYRWMKAMLNLMHTLRSAGVPSYCLSYEAFVFNPEKEIEKLAEWLRVDTRFSVEAMNDAATHELYGSPTVRLGDGKGARLVYDGSWLREWGPMLLTPLILPPLMLNRHLHRTLAGGPMTFKRSATEPAAIPAIKNGQRIA